MKERVFVVVLAQLFIGTGFSFLYMQHVRMVFESRTNIAQLPQLKRESFLRHEDALYYSFYKILAESPDFSSGYQRLKNITDIEYPSTVNVLQRFYILPELTAGFFFHLARYLHHSGCFPIFSCWHSTEHYNNMSPEFQPHSCDTNSYPMQFYLEFVWLMGGITLLVIYMYGSILSESIYGGIYGVISYIMFHNFVAKIYQRPAARENFAYPLICMQMFCITLNLKRISDLQIYHHRFFTILKLTVVTAFSLLCWQFSSILFTTQVLIIMILHNTSAFQSRPLNLFVIDYAVSQLLGIGLAYLISHHNNQFLHMWQLSLSFSLLLISVPREFKDRNLNRNSEFSFRTITLELLIASCFHSKFLDILTNAGLIKPQDNSFTLYCDLCAYWTMQVRSNFITNLASCNPLYETYEWTKLWPLIKTLILKPYCMFGVVMLGMFFRKWRKDYKYQTLKPDAIERAKKYLLEDFLEENRISMHDMSQQQTEDSIKKCYQLLKDCHYDYVRYKVERAKQLKAKPSVHNDFIDDIKRLRAQILKNSEEQRREQTMDGGDATSSAQIDKDDPKNINKTRKPSNDESDVNVKNQLPQTPKLHRRTKLNNIIFENGTKKAIFNLAYLYSFLQMAVFTLLGLTIKKLFFLSFTQGCVIAPTLCSKVCYRQHRNIFWSVTLVVFVFSMFDPGVMNVNEEYYPRDGSRIVKKSDGELESMLEWISINTERNAVFAGPIEIIGTVHLTTKRPIVNHAHLEMRQNSGRTEQAYLVYSRQQSNEIYNQYSQLKTQYLIISIKHCRDLIISECDILSIWDEIQPAYRKYPQFCTELLNKNIPSFAKVYKNADYIIVKMFSHTVQINLKHQKMPELNI